MCTEEADISCVQVGLDSKAVLEAWNAIHKKHPNMPVVIVTADAGE
jgi:alanyl-tRNA synthetase